MDHTPLAAFLIAHNKAAQPLYTLEDAADIIGITLRALQLMVWRGKITAVKRSPRRYAGIIHAELDRYLSAVNERGKA